MADDLTAGVDALLRRAIGQAADDETRGQLSELADRLRGPLRLAIAGKIKAGKSTLLNALIGEELAPTDAGECTRVVTWYRQGEAPRVVLHPVDGEPLQSTFRRADGALDIDLRGHTAEQLDHLEVFWPTPKLADLTLIDTPGIASISTDLSSRTVEALAPEDDRPPMVDAVLYLLRHTHVSDLRFLESFHDDALARGSAMNAIGVLSRADEIGAARLDALEVAQRIGRRYAAEPRLRRLCPVVVPVAGLLGYAGSTLREPEYRALTALADTARAERDALLLTVDRFATRPGTLAVSELERAHLLARFGLFGVRLAVDLIDAGVVNSATELSRELVRRSGLEVLRQVLLRQFTARSQVLKARSALVGLIAILRSGGCSDAGELRSAAEQLASGAHAFAEVRLLDQLRSGALQLPSSLEAELDRLLGGAGHDPVSRLGLAEGTDQPERRDVILRALDRWQDVAENPMVSRPAQLAARTACRTLEGMLAGPGPIG